MNKESSGEKKVRLFLENEDIPFEQEQSLDDLCIGCAHCIAIRSADPLYLPQRFDFYIPEVRVAIEVDGLQHFVPVKKFGGQKGLVRTLKRDERKDQWCINHRVSLIRIEYNDDMIDVLLSHLLTLYIPWSRGLEVPHIMISDKAMWRKKKLKQQKRRYHKDRVS